MTNESDVESLSVASHEDPLPVTADAPQETLRGKRERENRECVGGMRSPASTVQRFPRMLKVGALIRRLIEAFITKHPDVGGMRTLLGSDMLTSYASSETFLSKLDQLRGMLRVALNADSTVRGAAHCGWVTDLVACHIEMADDPDKQLIEWMVHGAPLGLNRPILDGGIFPRVEPKNADRNYLDMIFTRHEPQS